MWIGDGDAVFNFSGRLDDTFRWNDTNGFNNLKYNAYPKSRHYETWYARPYITEPVKFAYADLKRIIQALRDTAREMFGKQIRVGTTVDAGPEFVESTFKFERHKEILKGGPGSELPKSLAFLCCYARMAGDNYSYAGFPNGLPEGTLFGTFLGRELRLLSEAVDFDYAWLSNGFGLTHYAWSYVGECFNEPVSRRPARKQHVLPVSSNPEKTRNTLEAIHKFLAVQLIVVGTLRLLAARCNPDIRRHAHCWLRTPCGEVSSEFVTRTALANFLRLNFGAFVKQCSLPFIPSRLTGQAIFRGKTGRIFRHEELRKRKAA